MKIPVLANITDRDLRENGERDERRDKSELAERCGDGLSQLPWKMTGPDRHYGFTDQEITDAFQRLKLNQPSPTMNILDALAILTPSPQELDAIAKMEKDLMAKLERANKIDRLKAELRLKAEELRALADSPNESLTDPELDRMLADLAHDREFESRSYPQRLNPHP